MPDNTAATFGPLRPSTDTYRTPTRFLDKRHAAQPLRRAVGLGLEQPYQGCCFPTMGYPWLSPLQRTRSPHTRNVLTYLETLSATVRRHPKLILLHTQGRFTAANLPVADAPDVSIYGIRLYYHPSSGERTPPIQPTLASGLPLPSRPGASEVPSHSPRFHTKQECVWSTPSTGDNRNGVRGLALNRPLV